MGKNMYYALEIRCCFSLVALTFLFKTRHREALAVDSQHAGWGKSFWGSLSSGPCTRGGVVGSALQR